MDAINKTPAGPGAISAPEGLPLDEHVKTAWELSGMAADDNFAVALSVLPALPKKGAPPAKASDSTRADIREPEAAVHMPIDIKKETKAETKIEAKAEVATVKAEAKAAARIAPKSEMKLETQASPKAAARTEAKIAAKPEAKIEAATASKAVVRAETIIAPLPEARVEKTTSTACEAAPASTLRTAREKKLQPDDSAAVAILPQPAPIPAAMPDLAWQPQHGVVTNDQPRQQPLVSIPAAPAETAATAPRREAAPILAALMPNTIAPTGARFTPATMGDLPRAANAAQRPAPIASRNALPSAVPSASSPKQATMQEAGQSTKEATKPVDTSAPAARTDAASGHAHPAAETSASKPADRAGAKHAPTAGAKSVSAAAALNAPDAPAAQLSMQADLPADAQEAPEIMASPMPAAASDKEKRTAKTADSSQQSAMPALPLSPSAVTAGDEVAQARPAKQQPRGASTANANAAHAANAVKADHAAGANASLTYRFDKWNGNHAVTVQTAMPADVVGAAAEQMPAQTTGLPNVAQYMLSPSDQLVGQRLQEHLSQFGRDANLPSVHLRDTDEHEQRRQQQQQQRQQPQEDDEEEA